MKATTSIEKLATSLIKGLGFEPDGTDRQVSWTARRDGRPAVLKP